MNLKLSILFLLFAQALLIVGCSNPFSGGQTNVEEGHNPGFTSPSGIPPNHTAELVPSSAQKKLTTHGRFIIEASISAGPKQVQKTTTPRSYQMYSNVQGQIISNESGL